MNETRKVFSKIGLGYFIGTIVIYAAQMLVAKIVEMVKPELLENMDMNVLLSIAPMYLIGIPVLVALVKRVPATEIQQRKMKWWQFLVALIMCYSLMYLSNWIGLGLTAVIGMLLGTTVGNPIVSLASSTNILTNIIFMVILAPIIEELVFRKLLVDRTVRYGQGVSILLSGLMFGLFHGNLNQFVYAFSIGCFFAYIYMKTGNIKYTIAMHMIINFLGSVASMLLMRMANYEGYMELILAGASETELMEFLMANMIGWALFGCYALMIVALVIAGVVLFIVFRKKFTIEAMENQIPKGEGFKTVILNLGMGLFIVFWIVMVVYQIVGPLLA